MLDRVEDSRNIVRFDSKSHCKLSQRASIDALVRFASKSLECIKKAISICEFFKRFFMEPDLNEGRQDALDTEKLAIDFLQLVEHRQNYLFLEIKHIAQLFRVQTNVHWLF